MFLTMEVLEKHNACETGRKWFARHFPEGGELIDVINHRLVSNEMLHWGFTHLTTTPEEQAAYRAKLQVDCENPATIYESDHVTNSAWVSRSSKVENSNYVFSCKNITSCEDVLSSQDVSNSYKVYLSEFVFDSAKVLNSKNINSSINVINADYVVGSRSVMNAAGVTNSAFVSCLMPGATKQIKNCRFISECSNLKNSLFCVGIHDGEYMVFNKQVDQADFELIANQLDIILAGWEPTFTRGNYWPSAMIPLDAPTTQRNMMKQYETLPDKFYRWVKTLPGYDPMVLYSLTYNPNLL